MENKKKSVYIKTFGCQMNKADSRRLEEIFVSNGYETAEVVWEADVVVFNTCSVREHAEQKAMSNIGKLMFLKNKNPDTKICVVGCMAQRMQKDIKKSLKHVDFIVGPSSMFKLPDLIAENEGAIVADTKDTVKDFHEVLPHIVDNKRDFIGYVPIMKGCNNYCTYCIVPYVRGSEQYRKTEDIKKECEILASKGINDIMLLGQTVNSHPDFKNILIDISSIKGIDRVKFVTSYPGKIDKELVDIIADNPVLCDYFHIPVQSGSDKVLERMNRKYKVHDFLENAMYIRERLPDAAISSDFIVGFPGETEQDFMATLALVNQVQFDQSFTFKYSPRPGTKAAEWDDDVPIEEKKQRLARLNEVADKAAFTRNGLMLGKTVEVFSEQNNSGRTSSYKIVFWEGEPARLGKKVNIEINEALNHSLKGDRI